MKSITITGAIWKWDGPSAWYFLATTKAQGEALRKEEKKRVGWGSRRVEARLGKSVWKTSLFQTKDGPYLLPIKADVRKREGVGDKSEVKVVCRFL